MYLISSSAAGSLFATDSSVIESVCSVWVSMDVLTLSGVLTPDGLTGVDADCYISLDHLLDPHTLFPAVAFGELFFPVPFPFLCAGSCSFSSIVCGDLFVGASRSETVCVAIAMANPSLHAKCYLIPT